MGVNGKRHGMGRGAGSGKESIMDKIDELDEKKLDAVAGGDGSTKEQVMRLYRCEDCNFERMVWDEVNPITVHCPKCGKRMVRAPRSI